MASDRRIFIQVPAYRDTELPATLLNLYRTAECPAALRTCVVWQHAPEETLGEKIRALPGLEIIDVPAKESAGCNWARAIAQRQWRDEPYTLVIDSHHRFVPGWDRRLIEMYEQLKESGSPKPLLTAYLPPYDPNTSETQWPTAPGKLGPFRREGGVLVRLISYPLPGAPRKRPVAAEFLSLHFIFTSGRFNSEVRFEPAIYFMGDEVATALRAFTYGYDLFHPHIAIGWHRYQRSERTTHWEDHPDWASRQRESFEHLRCLFRGQLPELLGTRRGIADYQRLIMTALIR